jgi:hypothetical protein
MAVMIRNSSTVTVSDDPHDNYLLAMAEAGLRIFW